MENSVIVLEGTVPGVCIHRSSNPDYGYVRVQQERTVVNDNGFIRTVTLTALIHGEIEALQAAKYEPGMKLPGKIIVRESLVPFNKKNPKKDVKITSTGAVCKKGGQPIYRCTMYNLDPNSVDELVKHDNIEELKKDFNSLPTTNDLNNSHLFGLND